MNNRGKREEVLKPNLVSSLATMGRSFKGCNTKDNIQTPFKILFILY